MVTGFVSCRIFAPRQAKKPKYHNLTMLSLWWTAFAKPNIDGNFLEAANSKTLLGFVNRFNMHPLVSPNSRFFSNKL
jgi:hypothetical protein